MKGRRKIVPETSRPFCEGPEVRKGEPGEEKGVGCDCFETQSALRGQEKEPGTTSSRAPSTKQLISHLETSGQNLRGQLLAGPCKFVPEHKDL